MKVSFNLQLKFLFAFAIIIIITSAIITLYFIKEQNILYTSSIEQKAKLLINSVSINTDLKKPSQLDPLIRIFLREENVTHHIIFDASRKVLYQNPSLPGKLKEIPFSFIQSLNKTLFYSRNYYIYSKPQTENIGDASDPILFVVRPIYTALNNKNELSAYVVLGLSLSTTEKEINDMIKMVILLTSGVIIIGVLGSFLFIGVIIRRIRSLSIGTHKIAQGDYAYRVEVEGFDEITSLANSFNAMTEQIHKASIELNQYSLQLEQKVKERTLALEEKTAALEKTLGRAQESDRLKTEFLTNMSHELRTPLNAVIGFSDIILQGMDGEINDMQRNDLTLINNSGKHLLNLINGILDIAKIESGKMEVNLEKVLVADVVENVLSLSKGLIQKKQIEFKSEITPPLVYIEVDKIKLKQILLNILSNAIKFTVQGQIKVIVYQQDQKTLFEIQDTGIGIKKADISKVFDRFRQIDGSYTRESGGTGLGMSLVKDLVQLHQGDIWIESKEGKGTSVFFSIPIQQ